MPQNFALEQIVKKEVPLTGTKVIKGFDVKGRINLPRDLLEVLRRRQEVEENNEVNIYRRIHQETPMCIELTDYLNGCNERDLIYYQHTRVDKYGRILIHKSDLAKVGMVTVDKITVVGNGNKIFIYNYKDHDKIIY